jgi:hypothetical protein
MATSKKRKKAQEKILGEVKSQLTIKSKKLGVEDKYSAVNFESMKMDAAKKIFDDLNIEKTNLQYELYMKGKLDKESTIKLEKVDMYINKAQRVIDKYDRNIKKMSEGASKDKLKAKDASKKIDLPPKISVHR